MLGELIRELLKMPPSTRVIQRDIRLMLDFLKTEPTELIPWGSEETELLSIKDIKIKTKRSKISGAGIIKTIFQEPLLKYAYKHYRKGKGYLLATVMSDNRIYYYLRLRAEVQVYLNGEFFGRIDQQSRFYLRNGRQAVCEIERSSGEYNMVKIGVTNVAQIINPKVEQSKNPRMAVLMVDLSPRDLNVFLGLILYEWLNKIKKI